jgi:hypothetical protein
MVLWKIKISGIKTYAVGKISHGSIKRMYLITTQEQSNYRAQKEAHTSPATSVSSCMVAVCLVEQAISWVQKENLI